VPPLIRGGVFSLKGTATVVSVWYIADGETLPTLVTAHPAKEQRMTP